MSKRNLPFMRLYPGDYLRSTVAITSIGAQGLWVRIMMLLHDSERRGYLTLNGAPMPSQYAARRCSVSLEEYDVLLRELLSVKAFLTSKDGTIYAPELVAEFGKKDNGAARARNFRARHSGKEIPEESTKKRNAPRNAHRNAPSNAPRNGDISEVRSQTSISEEKDKSIDLSKKKKSSINQSKKNAEKTRIPADFAVSDDLIEWARENTPDVSIALVTHKFRIHFESKSGAAGMRSDWIAEWKKYLLTAQDQGWTGSNRGQPNDESPPKAAAPIDHRADAFESFSPEENGEPGEADESPPKPLTAEQLSGAIAMLKGIRAEDERADLSKFEQWYTAEDWAFIAPRLPPGKQQKNEEEN